MAGCSDGAIRFFGPQSGQLQRALEGAHQASVQAIAVSGDGSRLYSGDASGFFKVWQLGHRTHTMLAALKEHKVGALPFLANLDMCICSQAVLLSLLLGNCLPPLLSLSHMQSPVQCRPCYHISSESEKDT